MDLRESICETMLDLWCKSCGSCAMVGKNKCHQGQNCLMCPLLDPDGWKHS